MRDYSRGWSSRREGEEGQTEAQTAESGTKWECWNLHTLTNAVVGGGGGTSCPPTPRATSKHL